MLDLVMLRHMARQNGPLIALTLVDVLNEAEWIDLCMGYVYTGEDGYRMGDRILHAGEKIWDMSPDAYVMTNVEPIVERHPGCRCEIGEIREYDDLPKELRKLIVEIEDRAKVEVGIISTGAEADQTIVRT